MIKGFALNDERFIRGNKYDSKYFDELLERIKTIRVSERMAYQKITDFILRLSLFSPVNHNNVIHHSKYYKKFSKFTEYLIWDDTQEFLFELYYFD